MKLLAQKRDIPVAHITLDPAEGARLSRQSLEIVARLKRGPLSNTDLSTISKKYSSRIADCREAGYEIECYDQDHTTGVAWYRLLHPDPVLKWYRVACKLRVVGFGNTILTKVRIQAPSQEMALRRAPHRVAEITVVGVLEEK